MAYRGKLVTVQEALGESPNGSGFVITLGAAPGLDATNLVVGRVVGGMDLVRVGSHEDSMAGFGGGIEVRYRLGC